LIALLLPGVGGWVGVDVESDIGGGGIPENKNGLEGDCGEFTAPAPKAKDALGVVGVVIDTGGGIENVKPNDGAC